MLPGAGGMRGREGEVLLGAGGMGQCRGGLVSGGSPAASARERAGKRVGGCWAISLGLPLPAGCEVAAGERAGRNTEERTGHGVVSKSH